jgi:hypothetical protein
MLDWLTKIMEKRAIKRLGGIPLLWITYKPELKEKNVIFHLHSSIKHDEYLNQTFSEIADYIRENYPEV